MVKINDLIKKLKEVKDKQGNVEVRVLPLSDNVNTGTVLLQDNIGGKLIAIGETPIGKARNFPTPKQVYTINLILFHISGLEFTGRTKEEASTFITEHKHKLPIGAKIEYKDYKISFPSSKQLSYIEVLEENNNIPFTGCTFKEASDYISKYGYNKQQNTGSQQQEPQALQPSEGMFACIDDDEIPF